MVVSWTAPLLFFFSSFLFILFFLLLHITLSLQ